MERFSNGSSATYSKSGQCFYISRHSLKRSKSGSTATSSAHLNVATERAARFIERQARILQDLIFGGIHDTLANIRTLKSKTMAESRPNRFKIKGSSFATTVALVPNNQVERSEPEKSFKGNISSGAYDASCLFCADKHPLAGCLKVKAQQHEAKIEFLRKNGLCFECLRVGHMSKYCKRRMTCQTCQVKHPTILHIKRSPKPGLDVSKTHMMERNMVVLKPEETSISSALVSLEEGEGTGAVKDCMSVVPVQVKLCNRNKSVHTYAFLDPGSTDTFCTEKLMRQLNARGRTEVLLQTMGIENTVKSYELTGLEVGNVEDGTFLKLHMLYTHNKIPVTKRKILTQVELKGTVCNISSI